ncbi:unnamed protein product [Thlaspi arvense]|uniref:Uncharacterized protein n=1 Tax=Thlaspi arvense TaxID=13288 RepID=A0AAU9T5U0_THLAR|nr:unnamed protein product [Thlaspi arvense]
MALFAPVYAASVGSMESRKRKGNSELTCRGVPLPYLIRPRRKLPVYDGVALYNDYIEYASFEDLESDDDDDSSMKAVETSSLEKGNIFGLTSESNASLSETGHSPNDESDEEYVIVNNVEALPTATAKPERAGAIQMMELSKDAVDEPESEDEGSSSDGWVVL